MSETTLKLSASLKARRGLLLPGRAVRDQQAGPRPGG